MDNIDHNHTATELIGTHLEKCKVRFQEFMKGLEGEEKSTSCEIINKNSVDSFRQVPTYVASSKQNVQKEDCQLFSKLFTSCQNREYDLKKLFRHENQPHPAALNDGGQLHTCQKSHFTTILQSQDTTPEAERDADTIIIDGGALVNSLLPRCSMSFLQYKYILPSTREQTLCLRSTGHLLWKLKLGQSEDEGWQGRATYPRSGEMSWEKMSTKPSCWTFWLIRLHVWPHHAVRKKLTRRYLWGMQQKQSAKLSLSKKRHRYCRHRNSVLQALQQLGCLWSRTVPEMGSCTWLVLHSCRKQQMGARLPCLHCLRCRFSIPWQREEVCLANLGCL